MMSVIQRVKQARVEVDGRITGQIEQGLLALVCADRGDSEVEADKLLDLLETGVITAGAVKLFRQILLGLAGRNIWFGKLADIGTKREIGDLSRAGLIRVTRQGKTLPTKVTVHPWYGWRGDLTSRQSYIGDWTDIGIED